MENHQMPLHLRGSTCFCLAPPRSRLRAEQEAQALVAEGAAEVTHPRSFEANAYHQLAHTVLAQERLAAVAALLRRAKEALGAAADGAASGQQQGGAAAMNTVS